MTEIIRDSGEATIRVFAPTEYGKLTKASYQLLVRLKAWNILCPKIAELVLNQLSLSNSRYVGIQETKWTIRNALKAVLDEDQLSFLDLILYWEEDGLAVH
jgi:Smg protein